MDIRYAIHPDHLKALDTDATRRHFLVERLFEEDRVTLVYSHIDRIIVGGVCPVQETLPLEVTKGLGVEYFLQRRDAQQVRLGAPEKANIRTINQLVHPSVLKSCQLVMGMTELAPNSVWNTMPSHTHDRRMEVYFYFDIPADSVVFHLLGQPGETRHIVVRNEQAVITPSWSIHSGVGTGSYTFIWGMAGENQTFTDMDDVPMSVLR